MPRYLFHIVDGESRHHSIRDGEGAVLHDAAEARKEALGLAQDIAKHGLAGATKWKIVVTDEDGNPILTVPISQVPTLRMRPWSMLRGLVSSLVYRSRARLPGRWWPA
jgi:hypothetical protein